jgi:O-antigen/teichoic acid export membrane protein
MAVKSFPFPALAPAAPRPGWDRAVVAASPLFGAGVGFLTTAVLARVLSFDLLAVYLNWTYAATILTIVTGLGLPAANAYFAARDPRGVAVIHGNTLAAAGLAGCLGAVALAWGIGDGFSRFGLPWWFVPVFAAVVPLAAIVNGFGGTLLGERRNLLFGALNGTQGTVQCAGAVAILLAAMAPAGSFRAALAAHAAGFWVALAFAVLAAGRIGRPSPRTMSVSLRFSLLLWLHSALSILVQRADSLILSLFLSPYDVGVYALAAKLGDTLNYIPQGMNLALFVDLVNSSPERAARMAGVAIRLLWAAAGVLALALYAACATILPLFIPKITACRSLLPVLLAGAALGGPTYVLASCCQAFGKPGRVLSITATAFLSRALLLAGLGLAWGTEGARFAALGSAVLALAVGFRQTARVMGVPVRKLVLPSAEDMQVARRLLATVRGGFRP